MKGIHSIILALLLLIVAACERGVDDDTPLPNSHQAIAEREVMVMADGWIAKLPYNVPKPGSYNLPRISTAASGTVLGVEGEALELDSLLGDKIVLLTFIYSSCTDLNGCPLATAVFYKIKENPSESLSLQITSPASTLEGFIEIDDDGNLITVIATYPINGTSNQFHYRTYNQSPSEFFCNDVPPSEIIITNDDESTSGTAIITISLYFLMMDVWLNGKWINQDTRGNIYPHGFQLLHS